MSLLNWLATVFFIWVFISFILMILTGAVWYRWQLDESLNDIFSPNIEAPHDAL